MISLPMEALLFEIRLKTRSGSASSRRGSGPIRFIRFCTSAFLRSLHIVGPVISITLDFSEKRTLTVSLASTNDELYERIRPNNPRWTRKTFSFPNLYNKFLPYSFRSRLPVNPILVKIYLKFPFIWSILGNQFLVFFQKEI